MLNSADRGAKTGPEDVMECGACESVPLTIPKCLAPALRLTTKVQLRGPGCVTHTGSLLGHSRRVHEIAKIDDL